MDCIKRYKIKELIIDRNYDALSKEMKILSVDDCNWIKLQVVHDSPYGMSRPGAKHWDFFEIQKREEFLSSII